MSFQRSVCLVVAGICAVALLAGCARPPQIGRENRKWIESLLTAVSAHNNGWIEATAKRVNAAHASGTMSDGEFTSLDAIIGQARGGDWKGADSALRQLAAAQNSLPDAGDAPALRPSKHAKPAGR